MAEPLRLMIFDATRRADPLTATWRVGGPLYRRLGWLDAHRGVPSWEAGLAWLASHDAGRTIAEIQFWGHGRWGSALIGDEVLDTRALVAGSPLRPLLETIRGRLAPGAVWWFRTCETFGTAKGQAFARAWSRFLGARVAGFTHVIGPWQSGLHVLAPDAEPDWSIDEGIRDGKVMWSRPGLPNTVSCFTGRLPEGAAAREVQTPRSQTPR